MKTIALVLSLLAFNSYGQDLDSLKQKILKMDLAINTMHLNLQQSHRQYLAGSFMMLAGAVISTVYLNGRRNEAGEETPTLLYVGMGLTAGGALVVIDSHKWIGRGARRR